MLESTQTRLTGRLVSIKDSEKRKRRLVEMPEGCVLERKLASEGSRGSMQDCALFCGVGRAERGCWRANHVLSVEIVDADRDADTPLAVLAMRRCGMDELRANSASVDYVAWKQLKGIRST